MDNKTSKGYSVNNTAICWIAMIAWLLPIVGLPCAVWCIARAYKESNNVIMFWGIFALTLTLINGIIGACLGFASAS